MLQAFGLYYEPSPLTGKLFHNLSLSIDSGEIVVLSGNNGSGKTKLLEILCGFIEPDEGHVVRSSGCRIGYVPQDIDLEFGGTLHQYLAPDTERPGVIHKVCSRLGLPSTALDRAYSSLSVGERIRGAIGRVLMDAPNLLLLDEPTNHLDRDGREWLAQFLKSSGLACLMVSHDRAVVNAVADRVLLLKNGMVSEFAGGFDDMVRERSMREDRQRAEYDRQGKEERRIRNAAAKAAQRAVDLTKKRPGKELDPAARPFYEAKAARMHARAKAIQGRASRIFESRVEKPRVEDSVEILFNSRPLRHSDALAIRDLGKSYGPRLLFKEVSLTLSPGDRVAVLGPNGAGKTTLFRILLGEESPDTGEICWAPEAEPAYLSQERSQLDLDLSVLEALAPIDASQAHFVRTLLARLRMRGDDSRKAVRMLSVGERTKAELVRVLLTPANVLLLDEPTNHLDIESLLALESALKEFKGAILFTSHDQAFVERLATGVLYLEHGPKGVADVF